MKISKQRRCQLQVALAKLQMQIADARPELLTGSLAGRPRLPDCPTAAWTTRSDDARSKRCSALWSLSRALEGQGQSCTEGPSVRLKTSSRVWPTCAYFHEMYTTTSYLAYLRGFYREYCHSSAALRTPYLQCSPPETNLRDNYLIGTHGRVRSSVVLLTIQKLSKLGCCCLNSDPILHILGANCGMLYSSIQTLCHG